MLPSHSSFVHFAQITRPYVHCFKKRLPNSHLFSMTITIEPIIFCDGQRGLRNTNIHTAESYAIVGDAFLNFYGELADALLSLLRFKSLHIPLGP